jgi:hypothetical protein
MNITIRNTSMGSLPYTFNPKNGTPSTSRLETEGEVRGHSITYNPSTQLIILNHSENQMIFLYADLRYIEIDHGESE